MQTDKGKLNWASELTGLPLVTCFPTLKGLFKQPSQSSKQNWVLCSSIYILVAPRENSVFAKIEQKILLHLHIKQD